MIESTLELASLVSQTDPEAVNLIKGDKELSAVLPTGPDRFNVFSIVSLFVGMVALAAYVNARFLKLPSAVGIMIAGLVFALVLIALGSLGIVEVDWLKGLLTRYSSDIVLSLLLGLLLFAGAMQLDSKLVRRYRWSITYAATLGTGISILITGFALWGVLNWLNTVTPADWDMSVRLVVALLFAAVIAPTDPVAVMSILRRLKVKGAIKAYISGESLFNDATAIVVFLLLLQLIQHDAAMAASAGRLGSEASGAAGLKLSTITLEFVWIAGGAVLLGLLTGLFGAYLVNTTDKKGLRVLLTIGIALGTGGLADALGMSNAVAVTVAGIVFGQRRADYSGSKDLPIHEFWKSVESVVNPLFFALIGLELLVVKWNLQVAAATAICFPVVIFARYASLLIPWMASLGSERMLKINHTGLMLMTWAGMRGGVSFALALSLPSEGKDNETLRADFLLATFIIVVMSVVIQGLSIGMVTSRLSKRL